MLLVIREPKDAILGYCAWCDQTEGSLVPFLMRRQLKLFLKRYIDFHRKLLPYLNQMCIANFNEVISDFGKVTVRLNEQFGTAFEVFDHTEENQRKLFNSSADHLSPSVDRENVKVKYLDYWNELEGTKEVELAIDLYKKLA